MRDRNPMRPVLLTAVLAACLLAAGCGGQKDDADLVLAEVGERQVTAKYYKERLARLAENKLPRDAQGEPLDMAGLEGKRAFLDVIIDKELMVAKAIELGYLEDQHIAGARQMMLDAQAVRQFWQDKLGDSLARVTQADIDHYYSRLGESRLCQYLITDTQEEAAAARQAFLDGAPWSETVARYHNASDIEASRLRVNIPWGQYRETFQRPIFLVEKGEITEPIETEYGWWIMRVVEITHEEKPPLEEILDQVRASVAKREEHIRREELAQQIREQRNFLLDEEALRLVLDGLPEDEPLVDPQTRQPTPQDKLQPLRLDPVHADKVLLSFDLESGLQTIRLGDYKATFDRQNVFDRPRKADGIGQLRFKLTNESMRPMVTDEARRLGYMEDERVEETVFGMLEEMLVDRVNKELVSFDEEVATEQVESYYAANRDQMVRPERREGSQMVLADEQKARQAREAWLEGRLDPALEPKKTEAMIANPARPVARALFDLAEGEVSEPFRAQEGWYVVRLDDILPPEQMELDEVQAYIIQKIRSDRQEESLRRLLDRWRAEIGVTVHEDRLAAMPSWAELTAGAGDAPRS